MTWEDIDAFVKTLDIPHQCKERFFCSVKPRFGSIDLLYSADIEKEAQKIGTRKCGKKTIELWQRIKEFIYEKRNAEACEARKKQEALELEAKKREIEDPFISKEKLKQILNLVEVCDLPGIRYRKFLEFIEAVKPDAVKEVA